MEIKDEILAALKKLGDPVAVADPGPERWSSWIHEVEAYSRSFLDLTRNGPAWWPPEEGQVGPSFHLEEDPVPLPAILEECRSRIDFRGLNPASGGHLGYIPGGGMPAAALGDMLAAVTNRYAGIHFANPGAVELEHFLVRWVADLFGLPSSAGGTLTSGGSIASLVAITAARDASGELPARWMDMVVYGTAHQHHCLDKALRIAGLGYSIRRDVPMDEGFRMRPDMLDAMIQEDMARGLHPFLLLASAGTTDTGAVDPLDALADIAHANGMWFHVDAAYGGFFRLLPEFAPAFAGLERADSIVADPHKGLFLPYGTGAVVVREIKHLLDSHAYEAAYMQDAYRDQETLSPADLSPELTRHFRGLRMYFSMKMNGLSVIRHLLKQKILLARWFYHTIREAGFETLMEPALSVVVFRWPARDEEVDQWNARLVDMIREDGRVFLSSTRIGGRVWIRLAVLSFRTTLEHLETTVEVLIRQRDHALSTHGFAI